MKNDLIIAALIAFALSIILGPVVLPILRRIKAGQTVRDDGPQSHLKKNGTPTMGAFIYLIASGIVVAIFAGKYQEIVPVFLLTLGFAVVGFVDDFIKVVLKRSEGLTPIQKMILQLVVSGGFCFYLYQTADNAFEAYIPFLGDKMTSFGVFGIPIAVFIIVGTVNGANFTDGVDGLSTSVTCAIMMFFIVASLGLNAHLSVLPALFLGALLGFLMFNVNKALVFMGDTGSLALGGMVVGLAYTLHLQLYLPFIALIYFAEVLSVIIQVGYFKITKGKRIFRMAPLHHHYELGGWSEAKVVAVFSVVTAVLCAFSMLFIPCSF